jgi:hypothetical protein
MESAFTYERKNSFQRLEHGFEDNLGVDINDGSEVNLRTALNFLRTVCGGKLVNTSEHFQAS